MSNRSGFDPRNLHSHVSPRVIRVTVSAVLIAGVAALAHVAFRGSTSPRTEQAATQTRAVVPAQHVRFTIYPEGIHPAKATVRKGLISIAIEDLADAKGGVLVERIDAAQRTAVGNVRRFQNHFRGRGSVDLSPGVYELRVPDKSVTPAQLIVEP